MRTLFRISLLFASVIFCAGCEDAIDPKLKQASPVINIDAWVNNKAVEQVIYITWSVPYDNNETVPPGVEDAVVTITGTDGTAYEFVEDFSKGEGAYVWTPPLAGTTIGTTGVVYTLRVSYDGDVFTSSCRMGRVPEIDSITFTFEDDSPLFEEGYQAEFWAEDLQGEGDAYWIRTYKNGQLLNKPSEINIAFDAGISAGSGNDGKVFLPPIRLGINPYDENENNETLPPYSFGDEVYVEIHSISREAFNYLNEVIDNTNRPTGVASLFSTPLTNVSSNIINTTSQRPVVGFFNVASVSGLAKRLE